MILLQAIGITTIFFIIFIGFSFVFIWALFNDKKIISNIAFIFACSILFFLVVAQVYQELLN